MTISPQTRVGVPPVSISVQITDRCNLACSHCAVDAGGTRTNTWSKEMVFRLFSQLGGETPILDLTGGEPLVAWEALTLFGSEAANRGLLWGLTTNGLLLRQKHVAELAARGIYGVKVSLEGQEQQHDAIRGQGTYAGAMRAIDQLVKAGIPVGVQTAVSNLNRTVLPRLISHLDARGVTTIILFPLMPVGRQAERPDNVLKGAELRDFVLELRGLRTNRLRIYMELPQCGSLLDRTPEDEEARCAAGHMLHFTANGDAWPCPIFPVVVGSLGKESLGEIMKHPVLRMLRRREGIGGHCAICPAMSQCGGGCRALAFTLGGSLQGPDPFCWEAVVHA